MIRLDKTEYKKLNLPAQANRSKYGNKKATYNGFTFDSKLECSFFQYLEVLKNQGKITRILRQVPFHLAPNSKLIVDFEVKFTNEPDVKYFDTKGFLTSHAKTKLKMAEHLYGIKIHIVKKGDF